MEALCRRRACQSRQFGIFVKALAPFSLADSNLIRIARYQTIAMFTAMTVAVVQLDRVLSFQSSAGINDDVTVMVKYSAQCFCSDEPYSSIVYPSKSIKMV